MQLNDLRPAEGSRKNRKRIRDTRGRLKQQRASMFQRLRKTSRMVLATNENQVSISFLKSILLPFAVTYTLTASPAASVNGATVI